MIVEDSGTESPVVSVAHMTRNVVRQMIGKFIGKDVEWIGDDGRRIELRRTSPIMEEGWSAGVVFSGSESEVPVLLKCIQGLLLQPELSEERGGEIVISGPDCPRDFLTAFPGVRYEIFPSPGRLAGRRR